MRALVTGATGFLGRRLVQQLLADGHEVRCLVREDHDAATVAGGVDPTRRGSLAIQVGGLHDLERRPEVIDGCDVVFHLAAALSGPAAVLFLANVVGTRAVIAAAHRARVGRLVLVSSLAVHGVGHLRAGDVVNETCPLDPEPHRRDRYTYSKIVQEQVAWTECDRAGVPLVVVRPGVVYGPGRDCLSTRVGLRLGSVVVRMGGRQRLPYVHVENCARGVALAGSAAGVEAESFTLVDDEPPTARQLLARYRAEVGPLHVLPVPHWAIHPLSHLSECYDRWSQGQIPLVLTRNRSRAQWGRLSYSNAKAKARLTWRPSVGFPEGLAATFAWLRDEQAVGRRVVGG